MKVPVLDLLKVLPIIGPAVAATETFVERFEQLIGAHDPAEQAELREALADLQADNDEGHRRLQAKLERAAQE